MTNRWLAALPLLLLSTAVGAQTLFTFGDHKASSQEFLRAFNKNNQQATASKSQAMKDYLSLYINSRLKIQEAYERGYDSLPQIKSEVDNLRGQVIDNYLSDPKIIERLTNEAFQRSLKDIHVAHIFISFDHTLDGSVDTTNAKHKLAAVTKRLATGEDFLKVAQEVSEDPAARDNRGDIGYITVFTLPYQFESVIYKTAVGKYSAPYASNAGYHIFKNLSERNAIGKIKAQQILLAFPPGSNEENKKQIGKTADSLYQLLLKGAEFEKLAMTYSNDYTTAPAGGRLPDIGVGQYDQIFDKTLWALSKNGALAKPIQTQHGFHILKRVSIVPIPSNAADKANREYLEGRVKADDRWKIAKSFINDRVAEKPGVQTFTYDPKALAGFTDSLIDNKSAGAGSSLKTDLPVYNIGTTSFTLADWVNFVQSNRYRADRSNSKSNADLMKEFKTYATGQYYRDHLEQYNEEFKIQMDEFRDGNLFFEIMQQEVWNKAQTDSVELEALYKKNQANYNWKASADAVIFFCSDQVTGKTLEQRLRSDPKDWKETVDGMSEKVVADSARYEWAQIPGLGKAIPVANKLTPLVINPTDNTSSMAFVIKVYKDPAPRSYSEAKGLVMNDYQVLLEQEWIKELKKKYPVVVDQKEFARISK